MAGQGADAAWEKWGVALAVVSGFSWLVALASHRAWAHRGRLVAGGVWLLVSLVPAIACAIAAPILAVLARVRGGERALSVHLGYVPVVCIELSRCSVQSSATERGSRR